MPAIDINARMLATALAAVIPHVSTEVKQPASLNVLRLEVLGDRLSVVATDGYTLGCYRIPEPEVTNFGPVQLPLGQAKGLEKMARRASIVSTVTLELKGNRLTASSLSERQIMFSREDLTFPEWQALVAGAVDMHKQYVDLRDYEIPPTTRFMSFHLAKFTKPLGKKDGLDIHHGREHSPSVVAYENFVGIIQPCKGALEHESWVPGKVFPPQELEQAS